jgi:hypothetical protein
MCLSLCHRRVVGWGVWANRDAMLQMIVSREYTTAGDGSSPSSNLSPFESISFMCEIMHRL